MSFRLVGTQLLARWYEVELDEERQARMDEWLADLLDEPWERSHDAVPGPNSLLRLAIVPGTDWAVQFLVNDGAPEKVTGRPDVKKLWLRPIELLDEPFLVHDAKRGTILERSSAVNGMVMLRELDSDEMSCLVELSGAPKRVLRGMPSASGYKPPSTS